MKVGNGEEGGREGASERLVTMSLQPYAVADAPKVLRDLRTAFRGCGSFRSFAPIDSAHTL